jgi:hypothetical protein
MSAYQGMFAIVHSLKFEQEFELKMFMAEVPTPMLIESTDSVDE